MEKLKFVLFSVITLSLLGLLGYWSVNTLQSGTQHVTDQKIKQLAKENEDLKTETKKLTDELGTLQSKLGEAVPSAPKNPEVIFYKYQSLMDELQKLVSNNVLLKQKSRGPNVGTVQNFLNIYNDTTNKVDNDYGVGTVKAVNTFQKDSELNANGEAGLSTFNKMIDWLKKQ